MKLSRHIVRTINPAKEEVLLNTVTKKELPPDSSEEELRKWFFLSGQEGEAIHHELLSKPFGKVFNLSIMSTWECNLRCTHCIIKHKLVEKDTGQIDVDALDKFVRRCLERYNFELMQVNFSGGETLLDLEKCRPIVDKLLLIDGIEIGFGLYTNLTMPLTEEHLLLLSKFYSIGISIDGLEEHHNVQRIPKEGNWNAYEATMDNLAFLVRNGFKDKLEVQACLRSEFNTSENRKNFYRKMLYYGIAPDKISAGTMIPSKTNPIPDEMFIKGLTSTKLRHVSCCKYRHHVLMVDYQGGVYSDYYTYTRLGSIHDDLTTIEKNRQQLIIDTAPAINDPKCRSCPVVGYCWGGCSMIENMKQPLSKYCDAKSFKEKIDYLAENNALIKPIKQRIEIKKAGVSHA